MVPGRVTPTFVGQAGEDVGGVRPWREAQPVPARREACEGRTFEERVKILTVKVHFLKKKLCFERPMDIDFWRLFKFASRTGDPLPNGSPYASFRANPLVVALRA